MVSCKCIATAFLASFLVVTGLFLSPSGASCFSTAWPHEKSDLSPDPSLVFGRLQNGFRYVLKRNEEPRNRVAMSLAVHVGSLNEKEEQRGIAHFLEHMLFNGSTHFQPGALVEYFQSIGMSFGGDANAHTTYDETVYDIVLPQGDPATVEDGLVVFSDYARGALLLQSEIDRERGVIFAEKRSRDSAGYRAHVKELEFAMKGTIIPQRMPIGILKTLKKIDRSEMKAFYDAWYRPENMVLVLVGDFDPEAIRPLIQKKFSALSGVGPQPSCEERGRLVRDSTDFFYHQESEMGGTEVSIESLGNKEPEDDSRSLQLRKMGDYVAVRLLQIRLDEQARKPDSPFTEARFSSGKFLNQISYAEIGATCDPKRWQQSMAAIENSLRQALEFGFTEMELQRVKKELLSGLDSAVLTQSTRGSKGLGSSMVRSLMGNRVLRSPQQQKDLFAPYLRQLSLTDVERGLRNIWSSSSRLVKVNGNAIIEGDTPLAAIEEVYRRATQERLSAYKGEALKKFPYLDLGQPVPHDGVESFPEIGVRRYTFANGVVLNLKRTTFEAAETKVSMNFGLGRLGATLPGLAPLTESVLGQSGTGTLSKGDLDRILAGSSVTLGFRVNPGSFSWHGQSLSKDLELFFQVLQSLLVDPSVDSDAFRVSMDRFRQLYEEMEVDVRGAMRLHGDLFLAGGNPFFGMPPWEDFSALRREAIEGWYVPAATKGTVELSLVGDFDEGRVLRLAEQYFAVLAKRSTAPSPVRSVSFPRGKTLPLVLPSTIDKGMLVVAWQSDDFWDIQQTRGLHLLAEIFSDKLRRRVREKLGATYSPQVYNVASRIYKDYGVFQAKLIVDPRQIGELEKEVLGIAEEMWQGQISAEELGRAKGPMLTSLRDMVRSNRYWLNSVLSMSKRYPMQLQWPLTILGAFQQFSLEDVKVLAHRYLDPQDSAQITVVPK